MGKSKHKSRDERREEVSNIIRQMGDLGLSPQHEGIPEFYMRMRDFISSGIADTGKIDLVGHKRTIHYILSARKGVVSQVTLKRTQ